MQLSTYTLNTTQLKWIAYLHCIVFNVVTFTTASRFAYKLVWDYKFVWDPA